MFFHLDSIKEFKSIIQNYIFTTIVIIIVGVSGRGDSKGER
jgi:heme/copper-type cytochrome/quinol oxidase subunit 4